MSRPVAPPINVCLGGGLELLSALGDVLQVLEAATEAGRGAELLKRVRSRVSLCRSGCEGCARPAPAVG